ncbi:hypothetical protein BX666DRAFT_1949919, partial [Dichotomocladium elegans]
MYNTLSCICICACVCLCVCVYARKANSSCSPRLGDTGFIPNVFLLVHPSIPRLELTRHRKAWMMHAKLPVKSPSGSLANAGFFTWMRRVCYASGRERMCDEC